MSGALLVAFASYVALPLGLAWYIPRLAAQYGVRLDVERVRVEPFSSRLALHKVRVATSGDSWMEWSTIATRVDLAQLASGRIVLDDFHLSEAKLHARDPLADTTGVLPEAPDAMPANLSVGELVIDGVELATVSEALGRPVAVDRLRVSSLDEVFRPEGAQVEADLSIGAGRSRLRGRLGFDETGWILNAAEVVANDVPLDGLPALLGAGGSWRGRLAGSGPVRLVYSPANGAFSATTGGLWAIDGPELGLARVAVSAARADWNGAAFMTFSGGAVDALGVDGEVGLHELRVDVADVLEVEAPELTLHVDASQGARTRLSVEGHVPAARLHGKGGALAAVGAQATNLVSQVALTFADDVGVELDWLKSSALSVTLPEERVVDVARIELDRVVIESSAGLVSAAAGTVERVDWRGLTGPGGAGSANRLAMRRIERHANGEVRLALASAEAVEDRNGDTVARLRDPALDSTTLSPGGAVTVGRARIADVWLANDTGTLILEQLAVDALERDAGGAVRIASARAGVVDHTLAGERAVVGKAFEVARGTVSGRAWEAKSVRIGELEVETGDAGYALRDLALADAAGEGARVLAGAARLGRLELGIGAVRAVVEDLSAESPSWETYDGDASGLERGVENLSADSASWREGAGGARAIEAAAVTLDTAQRHRLEARGWRLTGVEKAAGRPAGAADTASIETLVLSAAGGSTSGAQRVALDALVVDDASPPRAAAVSAERAYLRSGDGSSAVDVIGLRAERVEWNGQTLDAERGTAPLASVTADPVRASFDTVAFSDARLGAGGIRGLGALSSASGRGRVDGVLEWSAGASALDGYRAPAFDDTMLASVEMRDLELAGVANDARLRTDRVAFGDARIGASGEAVFANAEVAGLAVDGVRGGTGTSARALRASPLTIRESALEIGALSIEGVDGAVAVGEDGDWELPVLPIGTGDARSPLRVRIREAGVAESVVRIVDRTTEPHFAQRIEIGAAALRGLDSEAVGVPARFSVDAASDDFTALHAEGVLVPTPTGTDLDLDATIRGLSLRALSPYSRLHLGRSVEGGHADVALDATIRTSDLEGVADLRSSGVVLGGTRPALPRPRGDVADLTSSGVVLGGSEPAAGPSGPGTQGASTLALDTALRSIEDAQGGIALKVPFRGKLDAPGFDLDGLVARALVEAAVETTMDAVGETATGAAGETAADSLPKAE